MTNSIAKDPSATNGLQLTAEAGEILDLSDPTKDSPFTLSDFRQNLSGTPLDDLEIKQQFDLLSTCTDDGMITDTSAIRFFHKLTGESSFGEKLWWNALKSDAKTFAHEFIPAMTEWASEGYGFAQKNTSFMGGGVTKGIAMGVLTGGRLVYTMTRDFLHGVKATRELQNTATTTGDPETNAHAFFMSSVLLSQLLIMRGMAKSFPKKPPTQNLFPINTPALATAGYSSANALTGTTRIARFMPSPESLGGVVFMKGSNGAGDKPKTSGASKPSLANNSYKKTFNAPRLSRHKDKSGLYAHRGRKSYPAKKVGDHLEVRIGNTTYYYNLKGKRLGSNAHARIIRNGNAIDAVIIEGSKQAFRITDDGMVAVNHREKIYFFDKSGSRHPSTFNNFVLTHIDGIPVIASKGKLVDFEVSGTNMFKMSIDGREIFMDYAGNLGSIEKPVFHIDRAGLKSIVIDGKPHPYEMSSDGILVGKIKDRLVPYDIDGVRLLANRNNPYYLTLDSGSHLFFGDRVVSFTKCKSKLGYAIIDGKYELFWDGQIMPIKHNVATIVTEMDGNMFAVMNGKRHKYSIAYSTHTKKLRNRSRSALSDI